MSAEVLLKNAPPWLVESYKEYDFFRASCPPDKLLDTFLWIEQLIVGASMYVSFHDPRPGYRPGDDLGRQCDGTTDVYGVRVGAMIYQSGNVLYMHRVSHTEQVKAIVDRVEGWNVCLTKTLIDDLSWLLPRKFTVLELDSHNIQLPLLKPGDKLLRVSSSVPWGDVVQLANNNYYSVLEIYGLLREYVLPDGHDIAELSAKIKLIVHCYGAFLVYAHARIHTHVGFSDFAVAA